MVLTKQINMYSSKNPNLTINGNGHTLDFAKYSLWGDDDDKGIKVKLVNLKTLNGGGWAAFDSPSATLEMENIEHRGETFMQANQMKFSGNVQLDVTQVPGAGWNTAVSSFWRRDNAKLVVSSNANVKVRHAIPSGGTPSAVLFITSMELEPNSNFSVESPYSQPQGLIHVFNNGTIDIKQNAQLTVNAGYADSRGINNTFSAINVAKGGELNVSSSADYAIATTTNNATINLSGAKFDIRSTKSNGLPLYMGTGGSVSFDKQNVRAWLKGFATATDPQYSWDNVTGVVNMSGANTTPALSNNAEFNTLFKNQNFSRISSDGRATQELTKTTINEVKDTDTTVSGKGEPNAPIKIMNGDQIIAQGVIGSDGNYTLTIPKQAKDSVIKAIVEKDGLTSEAQTTVKQGSLVQTTISDIGTNTTSVSGKGEPNAKIELKVGGQVIASGRIGSDGYYSLTIPKQSVGTVVKAVVSADGLTSEAHTTVTRADLAPTTISKVDSQTTVITGTGEPGGKIELLNGNQVIVHGYVDKDGHYSLTVMQQPAGSTIVARVTMGGKESQTSTVVEEKFNLQAPVIDKFIEGDSYAKGTAGKDATKVAIFVNGVQRRVAAVSNGKYSIWASDVVTSIGDKVEIIGMNANGVERSRVTVTIMNAPVEEMTLTVNEYTFGENNITGTKSANVSRVQLFVNGVMKRTVTLNGNNFEVYAKDVIASANDKVEIVGFDKYGNEKRVPVTIKEKEPEKIDLTVNPYKLGDGSITGTVSENVSYVTLNQGANVLKRGEVKGSNFSIWAQGIVTEIPGNYTIVAHTASGETKEVPLVVNP